ncbi:hypothetical protein [Bradyrhizobium sp. BR 1432]
MAKVPVLNASRHRVTATPRQEVSVKAISLLAIVGNQLIDEIKWRQGAV